jgi:hypothetical protein
MKVCTLWDPIDCTPSLYLDFVLFCPDDGFLQPKHVAKILKYCQIADIYVVFLYGNKVLLYYYNTKGWLLLNFR